MIDAMQPVQKRDGNLRRETFDRISLASREDDSVLGVLG